MEKNLKNIKVKSLLPQGINSIEHSARIKLGLNCEEYCVFDTILSRKKRQKETTFDDIQDYTGLTSVSVNSSLSKMMNITLIKITDEKIYLNSRMVTEAFKEQDQIFRDEFEHFWKSPKIIRNPTSNKEETVMVNAWPGPKELAFDKFVLARKKHSLEFILEQKKYYFLFLKHETWRKKMQASKFLNIKTKQLLEDFKNQIPVNVIKAQEKQTITIDHKKSLYD